MTPITLQTGLVLILASVLAGFLTNYFFQPAQRSGAAPAKVPKRDGDNVKQS